MEDTLDSEDIVLHPISLSDIRRNSSCLNDDNDDFSHRIIKESSIFSLAMGLKRQSKHKVKPTARTLSHWKKAAEKALHIDDPWAEFHLNDLKPETAIRHRYNVLQQKWVSDEIQVKIASEPFGHGAMRKCYRLKKLPTFGHHSWSSAANFVAKSYMDDVDSNVYFEDVKLQMDAKLWGEEYNRHNPPKKVDIFQMCVIEFTNRPKKSLYHLERYIEGKYMKYNSNSGYISCENVRLTPQAFSHFTFERSGHELMVVDIQGVGDLYTDPQIHTVSGKGYGDGNLGVKGMTLFFHSHLCNKICESLGLTPFDLANSEESKHSELAHLQELCKTAVRGTEEICVTPSDFERSHLIDFLRSRTLSTNSLSPPGTESSNYHHSISQDSGNQMFPFELDDMDKNEAEILSPASSNGDSGIGSHKRQDDFVSENGSLLLPNDSHCTSFHVLVRRKSRPSCVHHEVQFRKNQANDGVRPEYSILGQMHLELAKYHALGRFIPEDEEIYDHVAALFHLEKAANCGNLEAITTMSHICLQLPHNLLTEVSVPESTENIEKGMDWMLEAAYAGDRSAMIYIARVYDTGSHSQNGWEKSWKEAVQWYHKAATTEDDDDAGHYDECIDDPRYLLLARQAEMYREGGYGLERNLQKAGDLYNSAAECAMASMKGRLANKYYILAEEVLGEIEE